jgi:peroxiredoxin family protein
MKPDAPKVAVFLHAGEYDRMHQGLCIAAAAVALGRRADVFFFWWALRRLSEGDLGEPLPQETAASVADRLESQNIPTLRALLEHLRASGLCTLYACTGSVAISGASREKLEKQVDQFIGWTTILRLTEGITDRFYL